MHSSKQLSPTSLISASILYEFSMASDKFCIDMLVPYWYLEIAIRGVGSGQNFGFGSVQVMFVLVSGHMALGHLGFQFLFFF